MGIAPCGVVRTRLKLGHVETRRVPVRLFGLQRWPACAPVRLNVGDRLHGGDQNPPKVTITRRGAAPKGFCDPCARHRRRSNRFDRLAAACGGTLGRMDRLAAVRGAALGRFERLVATRGWRSERFGRLVSMHRWHLERFDRLRAARGRCFCRKMRDSLVGGPLPSRTPPRLHTHGPPPSPSCPFPPPRPRSRTRPRSSRRRSSPARPRFELRRSHHCR